MKMFQTIDPITKEIKDIIHCPKKEQFIKYTKKHLKMNYTWALGNTSVNEKLWDMYNKNTLLVIYKDKKELIIVQSF